MSTYGKKALKWWIYPPQGNRDSSIRYNHTPKDLQLQILEKWYPIGMQVSIPTFSGEEIWEIIEHKETNWGYTLIIKCIESKNNFSIGKKTDRHPIATKPTKKIEIKLKRDIKINKIINE
jgi:hypothetical protein